MLFVTVFSAICGAGPCRQAPTDGALDGALAGELSLRLSAQRRADTRVLFELSGIGPDGQVHDIGRAVYPTGTSPDIPFSIPIDAEQAGRFHRHRLTVVIAKDRGFEDLVSTNSFDLAPEQLGTFLRLAIQPTPRPIP